MPRHKDLKRLVRARMAKTGESYTTARRSMVGSSQPAGATESDAACLAHVLQSLGVANPATGKPFTVAELFGVGGGIGFAYFTFQYAEFTSVYTGCRINDFVLTTDLVSSACSGLGVPHRVSTTRSSTAAQKELRRMWDESWGAIVTIDRTYLPHYQLGPALAGMMPIGVVVEADGDQVRVIDGPHQVVMTHAELAQARQAVSSQRHHLVSVGPAEVRDVVSGTAAGLALTKRGMLEPPRSNFGVEGLRRWRDLVANERNPRGWPRLFDTDEQRQGALDWVQFWVSEDGIGGGYRTLYADFLLFAAEVTGRSELQRAASGYRDAANLWQQLARYKTPDLQVIAGLLDQLARAEADLAGAL